MAKQTALATAGSDPDKSVSVADAILKEFFVELTKEKDLKEVSERLEAAVLGQRSFAEASVRSALFEAEEP